MKTSHSILSKHWVFATVGAALISATASTHAAYIPLAPLQPEGAPGAALGKLLTGTSGGVAGNTVIASSAIPFTATLGGTTTGILRSMVVDTTAGYDFYYQVVNTSSSPVHFGDDIFRLAIPGYDQGGFTVAATYLNDGVTTLGTLTGVPVAFTTTFLPNKGAFSGVFSADRDAALNTPDFYNGGAALISFE